MKKWFDDNLEREKLRKYTTRRIKEKIPGKKSFLSSLSITNWIIIITSVISIVFWVLGAVFGQDSVNSLIAVSGNSVFSGKIWVVFTSIFSHANLFHLFVNMFSLFFLGNFIEGIIGRKRLVWFYLIAGIFAALFFAVLSYALGNICFFSLFGACIGERIFTNPNTLAVGASGAIFGIAGLLAVLTPKKRVYLIAGPLIAIVIEGILSVFLPESSLNVINILINLYIIFSIFLMFSFNPKLRKIAVPVELQFWTLPIVAIVPLILIGLIVVLPIGNMAHLGGLIAGFIYGIYLRNKYKKKTEIIRKVFSK